MLTYAPFNTPGVLYRKFRELLNWLFNNKKHPYSPKTSRLLLFLQSTGVTILGPNLASWRASSGFRAKETDAIP
jgi:hypothetical protein